MIPAAPGAARLAAACAPGAASMALGAVAVAAFGDWPLFPLPLLALAALDWLWLRAPSPRAAAALGFAFGLGHFLVGVSWVYVSLHHFGGLPAPVAGFATIVFCVILAAYPAAVGWVQAKLAAPLAVRLMLVIPAAWALAEWLRSWIFTGFPWLALGYSQLDGPLAGFAPITGVFGVSFLAAAVSGALLAIFVTRGSARVVAVATIGAIAAGGWALRAVDWTEPYGEPLDVALLQGNIPQELKFVPGRYQATLDTYARLAGSTNARLVVLPETAIPRFLDDVDPVYLETLTAPVAARGGDVLVGVPLLDKARRYYNAVVSFGASPQQVYAKSHLVPFGEFVPTGFGWLVAMMRIPLGEFARGAPDQQPLAVAGQSRGEHLLRRRVRRGNHPAAPRGDAAREREQRRLVRRLARPRPAPADLPDARRRDRPLHAARDQHRRHRDRRAGRGGRRAPAVVHRGGPRGPGPGPDGGDAVHGSWERAGGPRLPGHPRRRGGPGPRKTPSRCGRLIDRTFDPCTPYRHPRCCNDPRLGPPNRRPPVAQVHPLGHLTIVNCATYEALLFSSSQPVQPLTGPLGIRSGAARAGNEGLAPAAALPASRRASNRYKSRTGREGGRPSSRHHRP